MPREDPYVGKLLNGRYRIEERRGQGRYGCVYLARDEQVMSKKVVVKILLEEACQDRWFQSKFKRGVEALARVDHPGVVKALDLGRTPDGKPYLVMDFVEGTSLRALLRPEGMELERVAHILRQAGQALSAAHDKGVIHCDLKPENIMVQTYGEAEEVVKLIDFDVAKVIGSKVVGDTSGFTAGTEAYMAPERFQGRESPAADVYALGVIGYEMVTGKRPFNPDKPFELIEMQKAGIKVKPKDLRPALPADAERVILKALSFEAKDRQARARDFGEELWRALTVPEEEAPTIRTKVSPAAAPPVAGPPKLETAQVLFVEPVGHSKLDPEEQMRLFERLQQLIRGTSEFGKAHAENQLVCFSTGAGIALVFFGNPLAPVECARQVALALKEQPELEVRMGLHAGPVYRVADINLNLNVSGGGVVIAQSVAGYGEAGHILLSQTAADFLRQLRKWDRHLHDAGERRLGQARMRLYNLYTDEVGNPSAPGGRRRRPPRPRRPTRARAAPSLVCEPVVPEPVAPPPVAAETRPPGILTQIVGVSHRRDDRGQEGLIFAPVPLALDGVVPDQVFVPVKVQTLETLIEDVRRSMEELTQRALVGQKRGGLGIEAAAGRLTRRALPPGGFAGLVASGVHPQLDLIQDVASDIPWEVLEETHFRCAKCRRLSFAQQSESPYCPVCGELMEPAGGKLALCYHLAHLVRGRGRPGGDGNEFLFVEDPTEDLCDPKKDPAGVCAGHLGELRQVVERHGFTVNLLARRNATVGRVLRALENPALAGIYYFGHGYFPRGGDEGLLVLADGELQASQIEEAAPAARLVFLNACEGAATGRDWSLENRARSVAHAFARGGRGKVVIAPLCPVVNVQAAETALEFFRLASPSAPLGEALAQARRASFQRYEAGEAHLAWMAYRYFGDPNRALPAPVQRPVAVEPGVAVAAVSRVFGAGGQLDTELFSFGIDEVLIRAAKRRNLQNRQLLSVTDFVCGLIRKGDLTRDVLRREGVDPDKLYEDAGAQPEPGAPAASAPKQGAEESLVGVVSRWIVRAKEDFSEDLVRLLEDADRLAQQRTARAEDRRISEQDLLESLTPGGEWRKGMVIQLPPAAALARRLAEREAATQLDENGAISLAGLDRPARKIVETAHNLAQQRGVFPISNRLMLAALVEDKDGWGGRVCRAAEIDAELLFLLMIAVTEAEDKNRSPQSFGLSPDACQRIVLPVLEEAGRLAAGRPVGERELFRAFCAKAHEGFKEWLKKPPMPVDLDALKDLDLQKEAPLNSLDAGARKIVDTAHALAQERGVFPIPNRLLLAAFVSDPQRHAAEVFQTNGILPAAVHAELVRSVRGGARVNFPLDEAACEKSVTPVLERACQLAAGQPVSEKTLFQAFCQVAPPELKQWLREGGIDLDLLGGEELGRPQVAVSPGEGVPGPADYLGRILGASKDLARASGWNAVRTPHLFVAMIGDGGGRLGQWFQASGVPLDEIQRLILSVVPAQPGPLEPGAPVTLSENAEAVVRRARELAASRGRQQVTEDDLLEAFFAGGGGVVGQVLESLGLTGPQPAGVPAQAALPRPGRRSALDQFGVDLTEKARRGQLPNIVGRDNEVETAIQTLLLTESANPLLVGEAGVGKTAIVEGIAQRIAQGRCPAKLRLMRVIELSAGGLVANTRLRGEFEQRIQEVLAEARENVILFIDEIHTIVGAGAAEGAGPDAGNMLKAALARGEVRLIGATTHGEFKRTIARDRALSRRFQVQIIGPPSREATIQVLSARQRAFEQHHGVRITEEAKAAAVDLSGRYIVDKQWPAKARDVLERACVLAVTEAAADRTVEVTREHVAKAVSRQTGVPLERVSASDLTALASLEDNIGTRIFGQQEAVRAVAAAIRRGRQGLAGPNRPWGVFLFVGPPGVGKTELAKVIAELVYGGGDGLIRFDMADFAEPHSVAKLIGAPPGYVGYDQGAPLVERLRRQPYALLLFDEIEHAHENVMAALLRLLSEGTLADHEGSLADARNTIIIMTSNLLGGPKDAKRIGFTGEGAGTAPVTQTELRALLERHFPSKLIDRLDAIVRFNPLASADLEAIGGQKVAELVARLSTLYGVSIEVRPGVLAWLARKAATEGQGARNIQRTIDEHLGGVLLGAVSNLPAGSPARLALAVLPDGSGIECLLERAS
jgi:ATP-dependent Clp protease ATP-binding subunit ClpC